MKYFFLFIFISLSIFGHTQIVFNKTHHDFGKLYGDEERFIDFYLKNTGHKVIYLLSVGNPMDIDYLRATDKILPDSSTVIRFQINKNTKGRFSYSIPVYTSDKNDATTITLIGSVETLPTKDNFMTCPNFNQKPADGNPLDFTLTVETIDKETKKSLSQTTVAILQNGTAIGKWETNKNGNLKLRIPLGISYFYGSHEGYYPTEEAMYVNFVNNHVILELEPKKEIIIPEITEEDIAEDITPSQEEADDKNDTSLHFEDDDERTIIIDLNEIPSIDITDIVETKEEIKEIKEFIPPKYTELDNDNFDVEFFKPINITFIIDVSASMNQYGRLDLMKYALNQLVDMLRPQDKMEIVAYAAKAFVIMGSTCGNQKDEILDEVKRMKASGHTDGYAGIKLGYKEVWRNRIPDGQNHVIIITDGGFNQNSGNYKKLIEDNFNKKDITMSVVGVKSNPTAEKNMTKAAELGNGRFILIEDLADAQTKLREEIRLAAFRY